MSDFTELSPDPMTPFTPPGDTGWRDWFLRLGAFLTNLVKTPNGYAFTAGRMAVSVTGSLLADTDAITVIDGVPIFKASLVVDLPDATTVPYGRLMVTDASGPTFGSVVVGGGSDIAPVYSNGTDWLVG